MSILTPSQQAVYDRIISLKTPQCADDIAKYFHISRCSAANHIRQLYTTGRVEVAMKVKGVVYYKKTDVWKIDPNRVIGPVRPRRSPTTIRSQKENETKIKKGRSDSLALQNIWGKVVSK